jgi:hypothetical protein
VVGSREGGAYEIGRRYLGTTEQDKYQLFGSFPGRGVIKKHEVRICDRIDLEVTVFHQLNANFFPTSYCYIDHFFSKISPVLDQNINR